MPTASRCTGRASLGAALCVAATLLTAAAPARAQQAGDDIYDDEPGPTDEARQRFRKGVALTSAGKVDEALVEFQAAYDLSPNWKILYNIGQCSRHVRDHARSVRAFERYLAEGGALVPRGRRAEVERELSEMQPLVGKVEIAVVPDGAEIALDGASQGKSPLAAAVVANAGKRRVTATRPGQPPVSQEVDVPPGGTVKVTLELPAAAAPPPPAPVAPPPRAPQTGSSDNSTWIRVGMVGTGLLVVGAAVTGTIALVSSADLGSTAYAGPYTTPPPDMQSQASTIDTLAVVTDVLVGAAVVGAGVTIFLMVTHEPPGKPAPSVGLSLAPRGAALRGTF